MHVFIVAVWPWYVVARLLHFVVRPLYGRDVTPVDVVTCSFFLYVVKGIQQHRGIAKKRVAAENMAVVYSDHGNSVLQPIRTLPSK